MRCHNEEDLLRHLGAAMTALYALPYLEAKAELNETLQRLETEMNDLVDYGAEPPYRNVEFPFRPPKA